MPFVNWLFHNHKQAHETKWALNGIILFNFVFVQLNVLWSDRSGAASTHTFFECKEKVWSYRSDSPRSDWTRELRHHKIVTRRIGFPFVLKDASSPVLSSGLSSCCLFIFNAPVSWKWVLIFQRLLKFLTPTWRKEDDKKEIFQCDSFPSALCIASRPFFYYLWPQWKRTLSFESRSCVSYFNLVDTD